MKPNLSESRAAPLDGLRAIAVLIVMVSHAGLGGIVPGGFGVTIFFFLSGFLITTLLRIEWNKAGSIDLPGFYLRRTVRIIPPMLICIAVALLLDQAGWLGRTIDYRGVPWDVLFLSNYADQISVNSQIPIPLWSLNVEEHFYLVFPLLFIAWRARSIEATRNWIVALLVVVLLLRIALALSLADLQNIYYWSHTRIDSILYGCLLAVWNNPTTDDEARIDGRWVWFVLGGAMILATFAVRDDVFRETVRYSIQGVGLLLVFNFVLRDRGWVARLLSIAPLRWVADRSYVLYLIHVPLITAATYTLGAETAVPIGIGIVLSFLFAALMFRFVEQPLMSWRRDYQKRLKVGAAALPKGVE